MNQSIHSLGKKRGLKIALCGVFFLGLITNTALADTQEIRTSSSEMSQAGGVGNRVLLEQGTYDIDVAVGEPFYLKLHTAWAFADHRDLIVSMSSNEDEGSWYSFNDGLDSTYSWTSDLDTGELYIEVLSEWWTRTEIQGLPKNIRLDFRGVENQSTFGSINDTYAGGKAEWVDNFGAVRVDDTDISDIYFYVGQNPLGDFPEFPEGEEIILPDIECDTGDFVADAICKVNVLLFTPSPEVLSLFGNLFEPIKNKAPFGYFLLLKNEFEGMEEGDPAFSLGVDDVAFFDDIRGFLVFIIWLFAGATITKRIINLEI